MYENIGKKIKTAATVMFVLGLIVSFIAAIVCFSSASELSESRYTEEAAGTMVGLGFFYLIGCPLLCWIGTFQIYGFGELVDKVSNDIAYRISNIDINTRHIAQHFTSNTAIENNTATIPPAPPIQTPIDQGFNSGDYRNTPEYQEFLKYQQFLEFQKSQNNNGQ